MTTPGLPMTQRAIQFVGADEVFLNPAKPVPSVGPTQVLLKVEAVGICFSDTKLLHAFTAHPRKGAVQSGISPEVLADIPSYVPGELPTVPGHECCGRIVAVGSAVARYRVGERILVQTDYRHLPTATSNASFGYDFEGGLQEYVLMDERVIIEPDTGERFLIPVGEEPSASAVALLEPWACVERAYASEERDRLAPGGRLLVVADAGHAIEGLAPLVADSAPGTVAALLSDASQREALVAELGAGVARESGIAGIVEAVDLASLPAGSFDDIVYFGADPARVEALQDLLAPKGVIDLVLGGQRLGRPVEVDVGRVHYDLIRWVGTPGSSAADGYVMAPGLAELREGERVAIIGAAGPMGFMHVIRALTLGQPGVTVTAIDIDEARLAHLGEVAAPLAEAHGVAFEAVDSRHEQVQPGFTRVGVMVPSPTLAAEAVRLAGDGAIVDIFAGFAVGTRAPLDLDELVRKRVYLIGTSGSLISDMHAVIARLEAGALDTNISVDAVSGLEGVADALAAVQARTSGGKIVIYPALAGVGMMRLAGAGGTLPDGRGRPRRGRWTRAAEEALLAVGGAVGASGTGRRGRGGLTCASGVGCATWPSTSGPRAAARSWAASTATSSPSSRSIATRTCRCAWAARSTGTSPASSATSSPASSGPRSTARWPPWPWTRGASTTASSTPAGASWPTPSTTATRATRRCPMSPSGWSRARRSTPRRASSSCPSTRSSSCSARCARRTPCWRRPTAC